MAEVSQNIKYVKLDDGVSFALVRTNPKLTTNTKLMYNGKKMYMESYASSALLNTSMYKSVPIKPNSTYNKDIASFLAGSGSQAYNVYHNFSDNAISDSFDNQFETLYWCGAEYIDSSFYTEEIGFVAPLYLREKMPNYFLIFRLDTPSNYNLNVDDMGNKLDSTFNFKTDILDKAVLIKTFDLREGTVLGNYIHKYIEQDGFEFDKSMYVNFSNSEVTYYGIDKVNGVLEKKVESFDNELLKNDNPVLKDDKWFTEGFERNNLIFPYIINIEYLFDDEIFKNGDGETYDFARYIGLYCNNIEIGEFADLEDLSKSGYTQDNAIYYFEDNKNNLHRYSNSENGLKIDGKFDESLISGFEKERTIGYAEPLDIYEGFVNRAQYGFEILKPLEPGDWVGIEYDGHVERYFADSIKHNTLDGENSDFRFFVTENDKVNDIAEALIKSINANKKSKFEAKCSDNVVAIYAKREGKEYNGSETGGAKIIFEASLVYNKKISLPLSDTIKHVYENIEPFGNYYSDYFYGACDVDIDTITDTYKNVFKIYTEEYVFFSVDRYLKTKNGDGRKIIANVVHINAEGKIDPDYRLVIVENANGGYGNNVSVSSTYQVEIMDKFKPNYGVLSWFPVKDFDFDINYSTYGQYGAFVDECKKLSRKVTYKQIYHIEDTADSDSKTTEENTIYGIQELAKSPFFDDFDNSLESEYDYYLEQIHPDLCLISKTVPYVSKWGYYDDQKDSCENPYRLNINKVFGVCNLSANIYLRNCDENEYTHSMPYYMTLKTPNYYKDYQYIECDEVYANHVDENKSTQYIPTADDGDSDNQNGGCFQSYSDCVQYWINDVFKRTDVDMFSYFFSGKKYGKRFDKKYSRLLDGDKFHNPSTLFRGVKFEVVRQYNGVDKRSNEYNDYKFSFVYIPVMINSMFFNSTVYFVKNDTFKFIVGIVFVNTMLGIYNHNIFGGDIDYFGKGFLYAACRDIIRPENIKKHNYILKWNGNEYIEKDNIDNITFWENNYDISKAENKFYIWRSDNGSAIITNVKGNIIGELNEFSVVGDLKGVSLPKFEYTLKNNIDDNSVEISWSQYYEEYDITIIRKDIYKHCADIICDLSLPTIEFKNLSFVDVFDKYEYKYPDGNLFGGYIVDVSHLYIKSESIQNILINMGDANSIASIKFYNTDGINGSSILNNGKDGVVIFDGENIMVDADSGLIDIKGNANIECLGNNGEVIENLKLDIEIKDKYDVNFDSLGLKNYFSVFNQLSAYSISNYINNDYNVEYHSTVEDNKYKIRVIEPDCIEIKDVYEAIPVKITQNNKSIIGSVEIKEKRNIDKIGIKVVNRYSGFYNPIFNDILYFDDYTYNKTIGNLKNVLKYELLYSNTNIDYNYSDEYGDFGVIKNMYFHKTNTRRSDKILTSEKRIYPAINEYALDYRDYNIFNSSWDEGYFISQDDLDTRSICEGIGSMKDGLCMFGSKYLNLPDNIFIDTFEKGKLWDDKVVMGIRDITETELMYKEINDRTVKFHLFIEKRLKRYLKECLMEVFSKYINKKYSFGNKGTIEDDVNEYVEKNLLKLYKVDKVYLYVKGERMSVNNKVIENEYLKYMGKSNDFKIKNGFPVVSVGDNVTIKDSKFTMSNINELDRLVTYNLNMGFKESFGIGVSIIRK